MHTQGRIGSPDDGIFAPVEWAGVDPAVTFKQIASIAARSCSTRYALVCTFSEGRVEPAFHGQVEGWTKDHLAAALSLFSCPEPRIVRDLRKEPRYAESLLASRPLSVRFGAAVPLGPEGRRGFLAVFDGRPMNFGKTQIEALQELAHISERHLRLADWQVGAGSGEHDFRELFESTTDVVYTHDLNGNLSAVNRAAEALTGFSRKDLHQRNVAELVTEEHRETMRAMLLAQFGGGVSKKLAVSLSTKDGSRVDVELTVRLLFENGRPVGMMGFARDLAERSARRDAEEKLETTVDELDAMVSDWKELHRLSTARYESFEDLARDCLKTGCRALGLSTAIFAEVDAGGYRVSAFHSTTGQPAIRHFRPAEAPILVRTTAEGTTQVHHNEKVQPDNPLFTEEGSCCLICTPVTVELETAGVLCLCGRDPATCPDSRARDFVEFLAALLGRNLSERRLKAARTDQLTGLANANALRKALQENVRRASREGSRLGVVVMDVDWIGQFNSRYGRDHGDEALRELADRLVNCLRPDDVLARPGADRFVAVLPNIAGTDEARNLAYRFRLATRAPHRVSGHEAHLTLSIGVSLFPDDGGDPELLIRRAGTAMTAVKSRGRNEVACYHPSMEPYGRRRAELEPELKQALARNEFELTYQSQVNMDGALEGFEVLLAWNHPQRGRIPAGQFIRAAEECGLIIPIGCWVLDRACRQNAAWRDAGLGTVRLAVNVSALQFDRGDFMDLVAGTVSRYDLSPKLLELEITESAVMRDAAHAIRSMQRLRELGVNLAIDDFGTGYSSLSCLNRFPVHTLKIDRSFLQDPCPKTTPPTIQAIVTLAHNLGLTVVCEGVENLSQFEMLERSGCDKVQGYLFGRAMQLEAANWLLDGRRQIYKLLPERRPPK